MPPPELTLRARYIFPADGDPIESGTIRIVNDRIVSVGTDRSGSVIDLGNAAIVPGFVNAHTHLELSNLRARELGGGDFVAWLKRLIAARAQHGTAGASHAVARGIDACLAAGTTLLGDITTSGRSWRELIRSPLRAVVFAELIGLRPDRARETAMAASQFLQWTTPPEAAFEPERANGQPAEVESQPVFEDGTTLDLLPRALRPQPGQRLTPSLSPHAPYSTHPALYRLAGCWSRDAGTPVCSHLAETPEELQLLRGGGGPLREFLMALGAWSNDCQPAGPAPIHYVVPSNRWLIAHGNYFTDDDIAELANRPPDSRCSVVYCPRTHNYFGHRSHPYARMIAAGINVCIGTDSLASSASLSVLDEMRFLRRHAPAIDASTLLRMGTLNGAIALGRASECGSLTAGKLADLAVVRLPKTTAADPHDLIFDSAEPTVRTMVGGRFVFHRHGLD